MSMRKVFTIILLIQTLEDQSQLLFMILEIVNKLLKIQLSIQVLVSSLHNFLFRNNQNLSVPLFIQKELPLLPSHLKIISYPTDFSSRKQLTEL